MKQENLIAYALHFASFLIGTVKESSRIKRIILFGSVARGDFTKESDIDLFVDTEENIEEEIEKARKLFMMSQAQRAWELKGVSQEVSLKTGNLDEWELKRSIISDGILLYGKAKQTPEDAEFYVLLQLSYRGLSQNQKLKLWRKLYGHRQKIGRKIYASAGLLDKAKGKRIESGILVPVHHEKELREFLRKNKVSYTINELWSDAF